MFFGFYQNKVELFPSNAPFTLDLSLGVGSKNTAFTPSTLSSPDPTAHTYGYVVDI
jgi:hypothetical protein